MLLYCTHPDFDRMPASAAAHSSSCIGAIRCSTGDAEIQATPWAPWILNRGLAEKVAW
jgi:hypothetical protein